MAPQRYNYFCRVQHFHAHLFALGGFAETGKGCIFVDAFGGPARQIAGHAQRSNSNNNPNQKSGKERKYMASARPLGVVHSDAQSLCGTWRRGRARLSGIHSRGLRPRPPLHRGATHPRRTPLRGTHCCHPLHRAHQHRASAHPFELVPAAYGGPQGCHNHGTTEEVCFPQKQPSTHCTSGGLLHHCVAPHSDLAAHILPLNYSKNNPLKFTPPTCYIRQHLAFRKLCCTSTFETEGDVCNPLLLTQQHRQ